jgi:hypothetical protein
MKTGVKASQKDYTEQESNTEIHRNHDNPFNPIDVVTVRPLD